MAQEKSIKVLVTGFGPFLDISKNPSWEIARRLPSTLASSNGTPIEIIVAPKPIPAAYHKIFDQIPKLIQKLAPDVVVHIGLNMDAGHGVFRIEKSAMKEGYHDIPDVERRVFTRAENKRIFGKSAASLLSSLDLEVVTSIWQDACTTITLPLPSSSSTSNVKLGSKEKMKQEHKPVEVRLTDDVGNYVCGFMYYVSLVEMQKRGKRDTVFFHVPSLIGEEQIQVGLGVTEALIRSVVEARQ